MIELYTLLVLVTIGISQSDGQGSTTATPVTTASADPPIDGGWGPLSECSSSCGEGVMTRECIKPPPQNGGQDCVGEKTVACSVRPCRQCNEHLTSEFDNGTAMQNLGWKLTFESWINDQSPEARRTEEMHCWRHSARSHWWQDLFSIPNEINLEPGLQKCNRWSRKITRCGVVRVREYRAKLEGNGEATLGFGSCGRDGVVHVQVNEKVVATFTKPPPHITRAIYRSVKFTFNDGDILKLKGN